MDLYDWAVVAVFGFPFVLAIIVALIKIVEHF